MIKEITKYFQLPEIFDIFEDAEVCPLQKQADSGDPAETIAEDDERMRRMREDMQRAETEAMRLFNLQRALRQAEERALEMQRLQEELRGETENTVEGLRRRLNEVSSRFAQVPDPVTESVSLQRATDFSSVVEGHLKNVMDNIIPDLRGLGFDQSAAALLSDAENLVERMQDRLFNLLKRMIELVPRSDARDIGRILSRNRDDIHLTDERFLLLIGHINLRLARPLVEKANEAVEELRSSALEGWTKIRDVCEAGAVRSQFDRARRRAQRALESVRADLARAMSAVRDAQNAIGRIEPAYLRNDLPPLASLDEIAIPQESDVPENMNDSCAIAEVMDLTLDSNQDGSLFFINLTQETQDEAVSMILRAWDDISHYRGLIESAEEDIISSCTEHDGGPENEEALTGAVQWAKIALEGAVRAVESARSAALRVPAPMLAELRLYVPSQSDIDDIIEISRGIERNHVCERSDGGDDRVTRIFERSGEYENSMMPGNREELIEAVRTAAAGACLGILQDLIRNGQRVPENFYFSIGVKLSMDRGHIISVETITGREAENDGRVNDFIAGEIVNAVSGKISPPLGISEISVNLSINAVDMGGGEGAENMAVQVLVVE